MQVKLVMAVCLYHHASDASDSALADEGRVSAGWQVKLVMAVCLYHHASDTSDSALADEGRVSAGWPADDPTLVDRHTTSSTIKVLCEENKLRDVPASRFCVRKTS